MEQGDIEDVDDPGQFRRPPAPDDRLWRHPSEVDWQGSDGRRRTWSPAVVAGLTGSVLTVGLLATTGVLDDPPTATPREAVVREAIQPADDRPAGEASVVAVAARIRPAIVRLEVSGGDSGSGSGVLYRDDGLVLTNADVVEGARRIVVVLADGRRLTGTRLGSDSETDIAVVRIDGGGAPLPTALLGTIDSVEVGEVALAVGSPLGLAGPPSVSTGVVSAIGREVDHEGGPRLYDLIQTDATIAPGSSGGALVDASGVVIGITTAFAVTEAGAEGVGFATPIDIARAVAEDIVATGHSSPPWIGVRGEDQPGGGALVTAIMQGGPASDMGLAVGDVITTIDGHPVTTMSSLRIELRRHHPGDRVTIAYRRGETDRSKSILLTRRP